jgi:hypothetical protein
VQQITGLVDTTPPTGAAALTGGVQGPDDWYTTAPAVSLTGFNDGSGVGAGDAPWVYRFDGGAERTCGTAPSCTISASDLAALSVGRHVIEVSAQDALGNRSDAIVVPFKLDNEAPLTALRTVPASPDGPEGWFATRPWIVLSAVDQVTGSGVPPRWDGSAGPQFQRNGGAWQNYTGPFRLPNGITTELCFRSVDVAGNVESASCEGPFHVDDAPPFGTIRFNGVATPQPDGGGGWFRTVPDVVLSNYADPHSGPPTSGRFRYRVDNSPYIFCDDPCTVDPSLLSGGEHLVHWSARDLVGNTRVEQTFAIKVDTAPPATAILLAPAPPGNGLNGWHWKQPWVVLDAHDQDGASGVAQINQRVNGVSTVYDEPFRLEDGIHEVCASAVDVAGNAEDRHCVTVQVDSVDPLVTATAPAIDGGGGWHLGAIGVDLTATDATSGVDPTFDPDLSDLCDPGRPDEDPTAPSGICVSVDGSTFVPWTKAGDLGIDEGVHRLRAFAVDVSGRRSSMVDEVYQVDSVAPVAHVRLVPARPNEAGGWRREPTMVLRADDGYATSGTAQLQFRLNGGPWQDYTQPLRLSEGFVDVDTRVVDVAGNLRIQDDLDAFKIDVTPPDVVPRRPSHVVWSRLLGPKQIQLRWTIMENLADEVQVYVVISDTTTNVVRVLDGGVVGVTPGQPLHSFTPWDGRNHTLTGLVPLGTYYYRVIAIDPAGNWAQSRESVPITIRAL